MKKVLKFIPGYVDITQSEMVQLIGWCSIYKSEASNPCGLYLMEMFSAIAEY